MKKSNWLALLLMGVSVVALMGYRLWDRSVTDSTPPQITVEEGVLEASVYGDRTELLRGISAQDDRDGDVTDSVIVESVGGVTGDGEAVVHYAAFDNSGNVAKLSRVIRYTDYVSPRFRMKKPLLFMAGSSIDVVNTISAKDILDGDITHRIRATAMADQTLTEPGEYEVLFQVTNSMGDTQSLRLTAELYPAGAYNSDLELKEYLVYLSKGSSFAARDYLDVFRYSVNRVELKGRVPDGYHLALDGSVDTNTPGVYEVKYTFSCEQGYQTYTGCSRLVVIVEE
ncbi:MAG: hypothetical protein IKU68_08400 [Oscillospiraceae bacterium]|nr:hypothetical protein [Oscillospiraceae bacterium]